MRDEPGGERVYELDVELTHEDYLTFVEHVTRTHTFDRARIAEGRWSRMIVALSLLASLGVLFAQSLFVYRSSSGLLGFFGVCSVLVILYLTATLMRTSRESLAGAVVRGQRILLEKGELRLGESSSSMRFAHDGLVMNTRFDKSSRSWCAVDHIEATPDQITLYYSSEGGQVIPRRCFASPEQSEQFLADAQAWLKRAREDRPPPHPVGPSEVVRFD